MQKPLFYFLDSTLRFRNIEMQEYGKKPFEYQHSQNSFNQILLQ